MIVVMAILITDLGECGGSVVQHRTTEREVGGGGWKPTSAVLCP